MKYKKKSKGLFLFFFTSNENKLKVKSFQLPVHTEQQPFKLLYIDTVYCCSIINS